MSMSRRKFIRQAPAAGLATTLAVSSTLASDKSTTPEAKTPGVKEPDMEKCEKPASPPWLPREEDREFFERELASFVPDRLFDTHSHLFQEEHSGNTAEGMPKTVGLSDWRKLVEVFYPGRHIAGMFLPFPKEGHFKQENQWMGDQIATDRSCRGLFFVHPDDDPEWVREEVRRLGLSGLKCYHRFSAKKPTWNADIPDYLPEKFLKVANEEGWVITLHMVKSRAVADPSNQRWIRHYCETYPNMKLILAHSSRGFQPAHNLEGLPKLTGLDNLYFDTSANCHPIAHQSILRLMGHKKLLYGSDTPVCHLRGTTLPAADSFIWLLSDSPLWEASYLKIKPVLLGLEHLRSLKWACWSERLDDTAIEDIFWNNAARLLNIKGSV